ncbi:MAG: zinc ribbon domain-containing protein [Candidatus Methanofastidiosia archaeon]
MVYCSRCKTENPPDSVYCENCGAKLEMEKKERPMGLSIISVLWVIGGFINLVGGALGVLAGMALLVTFDLGGVVMVLTMAFAMILGLAQLLTAYGFWTGKLWSFRLAQVVILLLVICSASSIVIGASKTFSFSTIIWIVVYFTYIEKPHVKKYLGVEK